MGDLAPDQGFRISSTTTQTAVGNWSSHTSYGLIDVNAAFYRKFPGKADDAETAVRRFSPGKSDKVHGQE